MKIQTLNLYVSILPAMKRFSQLETETQGLDLNVYLKSELFSKLPKTNYVVIDTPPALGILNINALVVSDCVDVVVNADSFSILGLVEMKQFIEQVQTTNPRRKSRILLNASFKGRTVTDAAREALENDPDYTGVEIPHRQHIVNSNAMKRPALEVEEILKPFTALAYLI